MERWKAEKRRVEKKSRREKEKASHQANAVVAKSPIEPSNHRTVNQRQCPMSPTIEGNAMVVDLRWSPSASFFRPSPPPPCTSLRPKGPPSCSSSCCARSLPRPQSCCAQSLPRPQSCCARLPRPQSCCARSLPRPQSCCARSLPLPQSCCARSLPRPQSCCARSLPRSPLLSWGTNRSLQYRPCVASRFGRAAIAGLGMRQTEDLKVPGWIPGLGSFLCLPHAAGWLRAFFFSRRRVVFFTWKNSQIILPHISQCAFGPRAESDVPQMSYRGSAKPGDRTHTKTQHQASLATLQAAAPGHCAAPAPMPVWM